MTAINTSTQEQTAPIQVRTGTVVAVLTYKRPDDLAELLPQLQEQCAASSPPAQVLVVDNDPEAGARDQVSNYEGVRYVHEPTPGIAAARNRALIEGDGNKLLIFIDDDERPGDGWLDHLLSVYTEHRAAAVVGPVISDFATEPSPWITQGRVFDRRALPTGTPVTVAATNNLLLDMDQIEALDVRFDERFGLTGGSDTLFTVQLHARGGRMIWCQEAVVTDVVPANRATRDWVLRRAYRSGNAWSRVQILVSRTKLNRARTRATLIAHGTARLLTGTVKWLGNVLIRNLGGRARAEKTIMRGAGMITGTVGLIYSEYRRN